MYVKYVSEVGVQNDFLDSDFTKILAYENLIGVKQCLENCYAMELEITKRDDCLNAIAQHIIYPFLHCDFCRKEMVIFVDKFIAVKLYDRASHYWKEEIQKLNAQVT